MASARVRTSVRAAALAALAGGIALVLPLTGAWAAPSGDVNAQLDQAWNQLEPVIEQYNTVHSQLQANQAKSQAMQNQMQPLQLQVDLAQQQVGAIAAAAYMGGPQQNLNAVLSGHSPGDLADRLTMLDMLASNQRYQISNASSARDKYVKDKSSLDALIAQQSKQDADLAAKKQQIQTQIAKLQQLQRTTGAGFGGGGGGSSSGALRLGPCPAGSGGGAGDTAANKACSLIGKPYVWAGAGPQGYDCSGLTMAAWSAAGVRLAHSAKTQMSQTKRVSAAQLRPGDLIFFYSDIHHVGIYVGGGYFVHAPHTGDYVRMAALSGYYASNIAGYGRP